MKKIYLLTLLSACCLACAFAQQGVKPASPAAGFESKMMNVNGINIHYVTGGKGEPLVLVHGFGQSWYMWNRLLPELSKHFTIIAPDLRGLGESDKPATGYDKKTMAQDIHQLVKKLGFSSVNIAGHDIGLMVVYAYAAQFPAEVKKLALLDALLPGIEPLWSQVSAGAWWWGFFAWPFSPELVRGKEKEFLVNFWATQIYVKNSFTKEEEAEFARAYSVPGAVKGSFSWFANFQQDVKDNLVFAKHKLSMPVLAMGGDHHLGNALPGQIRQVATHVTEIKIINAGHWIVQEQTAQVLKGLLTFFTAK